MASAAPEVAAPRAAEPGISQAPAPAEREAALNAYGKLPAFFVENAGQADPRFRYYAQGAGYGFAFAQSEAILSFVKGKRGAALALRFLGSRAQTEPEGSGPLVGKVNYLVGNDPAKWQTGLRTYGEVRYRNLWPGVDMVFRGGTGRLKYEFVVRPGARVQDIRLAYRGAERLSLDRRGNLRIGTSLGALTDTRPRSYQVIGGKQVPVESRFTLGRAGAYGFAVGAYDQRRPLVIDPGLVYSTYLGGSVQDRGLGIAVDGAGSAYVTGSTGSANFPTTPGAFDTALDGRRDAFVTKLNPLGTGLVYSTYLGGSGGQLGSADDGLGIAVDGAGSAYVTGVTESASFPTTPGAFDTSFNGIFFDAFVTKLNPLGTGLVYSTYLGGSGFLGSEQGQGITVDGAGSAHVTGVTDASNFPTTPGAFDTTANVNTEDAFVTKLNAAGSALVYSTYLGGGARDQGAGIALDGAGSAYVTGVTSSANFPTTPGAFDTTPNGFDDVFVTKLNAAGSAPLLYSTYLGGSGFFDRGSGIAVDRAGSAYVTGVTDSANFPTTPGAFDTSFNGGSNDAFVTKLSPSGSAPLLYSTYLGGSTTDQGAGVAIDGGGSAYVTGMTDSANFPTTAGAFDTSFNGVFSDAFVTKLDPLGTGLVYSTYLGGSDGVDGGDSGRGIALDVAGGVYVTGQSASGDFPTTAGAFDTSFNGRIDAFATKLDLGGVPAILTLTPAAATNPVGTPHTVTATVEDAGGNPVSGVTVRFSVTGATSASGSDVTDANGEATFTYTGTTAGLDTISAFADTDTDGTQDVGEPGGTATKLWTAGAPASLTLEPEEAANRAGDEHCVTATVRDQFDNPAPGVVVDFSVSGANPRAGVAVTDANGQAVFCYTGTQAGEDTIVATARGGSNPSDTAAKSWAPNAAATVTLEPATDTNSVGDPHTMTATVRDAFGNVIAGVEVRFSVTGANSADGSAITDDDGRASFTYTGTFAGLDTITAFVDSDGDGSPGVDDPTGTATKTWIPGPPATLTLSPAAASNPVGTSHTVTATVADGFGNPTPGIVVRFAVTGSVTTAGSCTTNGAGQCSFSYSGPTAPGADAIHAYADTDNDTTQDFDEPFGDATKTWTPAAPARLTLSPAAASNPVGTSHTVTATVADGFGNPTPMIVVRFAVTGSVTTAGSCTTDGAGQCGFSYSGPTAPGADAIHAYADTDNDTTQDFDEPFGDATKTWTPAAPATLTLEPESDTNTVGEEHCVTATVRDQFGNPVPGVPVDFDVAGANPGAGASVTGANGQASFCYTGTVAGTDTITATAEGGSNPSDTATKVYQPGSPFRLLLAPPTATNTVDEQHCVTATVRDRFGNPTPGITVRFTVTGSVNTGGTGTTDADGQATYCYTGPALPGSDLISAVADTNDNGVQDPGEPSDTATKLWVLPPSTAGCKVTYGGRITAANGDKGTFGGNAQVPVGGSPKGQEEYQDHGPVQPMNVHSINVQAVVCSADGTQASIFGQATIDGSGTFDYRIDLKDLGEPGTLDTYRIRLSNGYDSGEQVLEQGNVQIDPP